MQRAGGMDGAGVLRARAEALAAAWADAAAATTTPGRERGILRLLGVGGRTASGRSLVGAVADRYFAADPGRLAQGVALPFAAALDTTGLAPVALAMAVAEGAVDLGASAGALRDPAVRDAAHRLASELAAATLERIDANRTARGELRALLGEPSQHALGVSLRSATLPDASAAAADATAAGADLILLGPSGVSPDPATVPARSAPGLAWLRTQLDEAGAVRGRYVLLGVEVDALAADQAVAAGLERADLAVADPMAAIVGGLATPGHAIADHLFACRMLARAGMELLVPAGPLVVAPDLQTGVASSPATRSGRALAIQLLAVALAKAVGLPSGRIIVAGLPAWLAEEDGAIGHATAELAARRLLLADCRVALVQPEGSSADDAVWRALATVLLADDGLDLVVARGQGAADGLAATRDGFAVATQVGASRAAGELSDTAAAYRDAMLEAVGRELDALDAGGWAAIIGDPLEAAAGEPRAGVALRTDGFDPLG